METETVTRDIIIFQFGLNQVETSLKSQILLVQLSLIENRGKNEIFKR